LVYSSAYKTNSGIVTKKILFILDAGERKEKGKSRLNKNQISKEVVNGEEKNCQGAVLNQDSPKFFS